MAKIFYIHWHAQELAQRIAPLEAAGHEVRSHSDTQEVARWGDYLPDVVVLSLHRLPTHSRAYAEWIWETKKRDAGHH